MVNYCQNWACPDNNITISYPIVFSLKYKLYEHTISAMFHYSMDSVDNYKVMVLEMLKKMSEMGHSGCLLYSLRGTSYDTKLQVTEIGGFHVLMDAIYHAANNLLKCI